MVVSEGVLYQIPVNVFSSLCRLHVWIPMYINPSNADTDLPEIPRPACCIVTKR